MTQAAHASTPAPEASNAPVRRVPWAAIALAAAVVLAYAASLGGGFLDYDDPWLVADNPVLRDVRPAAIVRIWTALDEPSRMALGAEYLPVRDTSHWIEARLFGLWPQGMRAVNLGLYVLAMLFLRAWLLGSFAATGLPARAAELAAWVFALHPVHAESVAWLAGRKDVLALAFVATALWLYARPSARGRWAVPLLAGLAMASKGVAVVAPCLLLLHDVWVGRRPAWRLVSASALLVGLVLVVQIRTGALVGMVAQPAGGTRLGAAATMGPVWLRYLGHLVAPAHLSVFYDVPVRGWGDPLVWAGWLCLGAWLGAGVWLWRRRGHRLTFVAFLWFVLGLAPTSQVLVPLQNLMADRYLLFAALSVALLAGFALARLPLRVRGALVGAFVVLLGLSTAARARDFADPARLWTLATLDTKEAATPPYMLGLALAARGEAPGAEAMLREAISRAEGRQAAREAGRRAANNLAALLAAQGRLAEAEGVLRAARKAHPNDPKVLGNLAEIVARQGREPEARALYDELARRFPSYTQGLANRARWFGF